MRRFISLFLLVLLATLVAAAPAGANAKRNETFKLHGWSDQMTVDVSAGPGSLQRLGYGDVARLGDATVEQSQHFAAVDGWAPADLLGVQVTGVVTITSPNGKDVLYGTYQASVVHAFTPPGYDDPAAMYVGTLTFTGGVGRFAGAQGSAELVGGHCFNWNMGFFDFDGQVTVPK
jgi:hypothetical protein